MDKEKDEEKEIREEKEIERERASEHCYKHQQAIYYYGSVLMPRC